MRVELKDFQVVGPKTRYGEIWGVVDGGREATFINSIGGITISDGDFNPERMQIDDDISRLGGSYFPDPKMGKQT